MQEVVCSLLARENGNGLLAEVRQIDSAAGWTKQLLWLGEHWWGGPTRRSLRSAWHRMSMGFKSWIDLGRSLVAQSCSEPHGV